MAGKNLFNTVKVNQPQRSGFDLTHDVKMSLKMGLLYPVMCLDCVPGDSFRIGCESLLRFLPLIAPVMHRFDVYVHYFFVPNRLIWKNWQYFMAGNDASSFPGPFLNWNETTAGYGKLGDYLGLPPYPSVYTGLGMTTGINAMPFAAYHMICDEYYMDENLGVIYFGNEATSGVAGLYGSLVDGDNTTAFSTSGSGAMFQLRRRAWQHDYFTSCLPFAQKGSSVDIPSLGTAQGVDLRVLRDVTGTATTIATTGGSGANPLSIGEVNTTDPDIGADQLYALGEDLNVLSTGTINDLRTAVKLQEYLELAARGGTRYTEFIKAMFGVRSSDARLQRPEYITGIKSPVIVSEVLNTTGESGGLPQGNMSGHATAVNSGKYGKYYCEEYGWMMGIMSVMPKTAYQQGVARKFRRFADPLEYYNPKFDGLGEQAVLNAEIYPWVGSGSGYNQQDGTFGYIPRFSEYRFENNRVAGDLRTSLDFWHEGRIFDDAYPAPTCPTLSNDFIECTPSDRIFAVTDPDQDNLIVHHLNKIYASRLMSKYGTPFTF